jgi:polyisoprenoid-binding protein YceI
MIKILLLAMLAIAAQAQAVFTVDATESHATFTLPDVLHAVHGSFDVKRGSIQFDPSTGEASGEIVVDATSGDSGNGLRDKRMHLSILESRKFPEITFVPSRLHGAVNSSGESKVEIDGTFTIHGASHPLTASAVVIATGDRLQAKVHFAVPYVSWGMKNPSTLFLRCAESVDIDVDVSGHVTWPLGHGHRAARSSSAKRRFTG